MEDAGPSSVTSSEIAGLREKLEAELAEVLAGWDRPDGPLRITKDRLRRANSCPAQLAGASSPGMNEHLALGRVVDVAAAVLAVAPDAPHERLDDTVTEAAWSHAIAVPLRRGDAELHDWFAALDTSKQVEHEQLVEDRCAALKGVIGDLSSFTVVSQNSMIVDLEPGVSLSGRPDLLVVAAQRMIVEVKSGKGHGLTGELGFYSLVDSLLRGTAPNIAVGITLVPSAATRIIPVDIELLDRVRRQVVATARLCREVDESVAIRRWPRTSPGMHCVFCDLASKCPSIPDEYRDEAVQLASEDDDSDGELEEEPW